MIKNLENENEVDNTRYKSFNILNNIPNDNLINMANTIDTISLDDLNGTTMDMLNNSQNIKIPMQKIFNKSINDNETLIKSLTKEILNNLQDKENLSINIRPDEEEEEDENEELKNDRKSHHKKNKKSKKTENFDNTNNYFGLVFDNSFGIKDFILLFSIYFLLSQDMIKDFFSKYFTSLNVDSEGKVNIQGVIIYGLILTVLFTISRKLI